MVGVLRTQRDWARTKCCPIFVQSFEAIAISSRLKPWD
jgi:hypothetical protein